MKFLCTVNVADIRNNLRNAPNLNYYSALHFSKENSMV